MKKDDPDGEERFVSEMMRITTLTEPNMIFSRLNHLIKHLAQTKVSLDYARLASDIYRIQNYGGDQVRMDWGMDFYA